MKRLASSAAALACILCLLIAQEQPTLPTKDLPDDQVQTALITGHSLGLPSPPELLYVLSKQGSPKWRGLYHPVLQAQESDRQKISLRLGLSIAEGHLATMARDSQKIRDVTNDLQRYAKVLGIGDGLAENARDINSLAEKKAWASVAYQLESLVTQTSDILRAQRDPELADLIHTGLWLRILHVSSSVVTEKDFPQSTNLAICHQTTLDRIIAPHKDTKLPIVISIRDQLSKISRLWGEGKLAIGHKFDDALIKDTNARLAAIIRLYTK